MRALFTELYRDRLQSGTMTIDDSRFSALFDRQIEELESTGSDSTDSTAAAGIHTPPSSDNEVPRPASPNRRAQLSSAETTSTAQTVVAGKATRTTAFVDADYESAIDGSTDDTGGGGDRSCGTVETCWGTG